MKKFSKKLFEILVYIKFQILQKFYALKNNFAYPYYNSFAIETNYLLPILSGKFLKVASNSYKKFTCLQNNLLIFIIRKEVFVISKMLTFKFYKYFASNFNR